MARGTRHFTESLVLGENLQMSSRTNAALCRERTKQPTPTGTGLVLLSLVWHYPANTQSHSPSTYSHTATAWMARKTATIHAAFTPHSS